MKKKEKEEKNRGVQWTQLMEPPNRGSPRGAQLSPGPHGHAGARFTARRRGVPRYTGAVHRAPNGRASPRAARARAPAR